MSARLPVAKAESNYELTGDSYRNRWGWARLHSDAAYGHNVQLKERGFVWSHQTAERWMNPHSEKVSPAERAATYLRGLLEVGAQRKSVEAIADAICHVIGGRYVRIEGRGAESIAAGCAEVSRETGELLAVVVASLEDGLLTSEEMEKIRTELREAETSFAELAAAIDAAEVARCHPQ